ncbi:hypothetical protein [Bradyrhizobium sp. LHD-71]|uniref:hypothetical protein n=1 Tax=Bradyrhizobium sp. LHD-71 TaxID=3072141 RepID=UPI00280EEEAB|nr:hypothetical protein [Bradyrhizobium sp. LHD-71]MDQ8726296.1 hypothetical protein [Bradyrhizobium sp. LHD-71]
MNKNIVFLRENVAAPASRSERANTFKTRTTAVLPMEGRPRAPVRRALVAGWHTNPTSGRLECRWTEAAATDDGDSLRRAA